MYKLSRQVDLLVKLALAEDEQSRSALKRELASFLNTKTPEHTCEKSVEEVIESALQELGIPSHIKGHRCIASAVRRVVENPKIIENVIGELYPSVADDVDTTPVCAERAIRHAVEIAFDRAGVKVLDKYFGNTVSGASGKPSNSQFIAQVAQHIRRQVDR